MNLNSERPDYTHEEHEHPEFGFFLRRDDYVPGIWLVQIHRFATVNTPNYRHNDRERVWISATDKLIWALPDMKPKPLHEGRLNVARWEVAFTQQELFETFKGFVEERFENARHRQKYIEGEMAKLMREEEDVNAEYQDYAHALIMAPAIFQKAFEEVPPSQPKGATTPEIKSINDVNEAWKRFAEELGDNGNHE